MSPLSPKCRSSGCIGWWPYWNAALGEIRLGVGDGVVAVVEDARRERSIGLAFVEHLVQVLQLARAAAGDHWHADRLGHHAGQAQLVAFARAIGIDAVDDQLTRAELDASGRPLQRLHTSAIAATVGDDLVEVALGVPEDVHRQHDALRAEAVGALGDQARVEHRLGIDTHLVRTCAEKSFDVLCCAHPATHGQRYEHLASGAMQHIEDQTAVFGGRRDVVEDQLISPLAVVPRRQLDGVADDLVGGELDATDDLATVDIQARDDAAGQHAATSASCRRSLPLYSALPTIAPSAPAPASSRKCSSEATPPLASTGKICATSRVASTFGPPSMPSRPMSVYSTRCTPTPTRRWQNGASSSDEVLCQPRAATCWPWASTAMTSRSAPSALTQWLSWSGRSTAAVPTITRSAPAASNSCAASSVRTPPPTCTGTLTARSRRSITSAFARTPSRAPSRSTICKRAAPSLTHWRAMATGSSPNTVSCEKSPCRKRTQRPPRMSIAGMTTSFILSEAKDLRPSSRSFGSQARLRMRHRRIRDDAREVRIQPQAQVGTLLGMELRRDDIFARDDRGELDAVLGDAEGRFRIWLGVVRVHEVEVAAARDAVQQRVVVFEPDVVPADLRHLQAWRCRKTAHDTRQNAQALDAATFFAAVEQQLLPNAHTEERPPRRGVRPQWLDQPEARKRAHGVLGRADTRQHQALGGFEIGRVAGDLRLLA